MSRSESVKEFSNKLFDSLNESLGQVAPYDYCHAQHSLPEEWRSRMNLLIAEFILDLTLSNDEIRGI